MKGSYYCVSRSRENGNIRLQPSACQCQAATAKAALQGRTYFHPASFICLEFEGKTTSLSLLSLDPAWLIQYKGLGLQRFL
jgi:hypothetical protein